jgi:hypothetical protein
MILLFVIIGHYINYEYYNNFSEHSQITIYGLHPDYKNNFQYPTSCNQSRMVNIYIEDINYILDLDWKVYNKNGYFDFWQSEYINQYDYNQNQHNEFDFFVNYLIYKNEILNISNQYNDIIKDLYLKYYINNDENIEKIKNLDKIDKIKYDKIKFQYDITYLNNLFESLNTTLKFNNLYEIWTCSL